MRCLFAAVLALASGAAEAAVEPGTGQWFASEVIGSDAHGDDGADIGEVLDFALDDEGFIREVVIEAGGVLEVGDVHLLVPWDQAQVVGGLEAVRVPLDADTWGEFHVPDLEQALSEELRRWRLTDLLDADVLFGREPFGEVEGAIFNEESMLVAVVARSSETGANYALPRTAIRMGPRFDEVEYVTVQNPNGVPEDWLLDVTPQPLNLRPLAETPDKEAIPPREAEEARLAHVVAEWEDRVERYRAVHGRTTGPAAELVSEFQALKLQRQKLRQTEGSAWIVERQMFDDALNRLRNKWEQLAEAAE